MKIKDVILTVKTMEGGSASISISPKIMADLHEIHNVDTLQAIYYVLLSEMEEQIGNNL